jgi:hypothetical protein
MLLGMNVDGFIRYVLIISYLGVASVTFPIHALSTWTGEKELSLCDGSVLIYPSVATL